MMTGCHAVKMMLTRQSQLVGVQVYAYREQLGAE